MAADQESPINRPIGNEPLSVTAILINPHKYAISFAVKLIEPKSMLQIYLFKKDLMEQL